MSAQKASGLNLNALSEGALAMDGGREFQSFTIRTANVFLLFHYFPSRLTLAQGVGDAIPP